MADTLDRARNMINTIDKQMAVLFEERMRAVELVAAYKKERGIPIFDAEREQAVLLRNLENIADPELKAYYKEYIQSVMDISKNYQHRLLEGSRVAYSGVPGAFAYAAAIRIFPDSTPVSYDSFEAAYKAVADGYCDYAVLPIENSFHGEVNQVTDLMYSGPLFINSIYSLPIRQNLLAVKGATKEDIKTVMSHPQALGQCASYIKVNGLEAKEMNNTARAAKLVSEMNDKSVAAIASTDTAAIYGLNILEKNINDSADNTTRFAVFSRVPDIGGISPQDALSGNSYFIMLFTVKHAAGALAGAIEIIGRYGFNMRCLRSRPAKAEAWKYYFYVEAEGSDDSLNAKNMVNELRTQCDMIKIVGHCRKEMMLED